MTQTTLVIGADSVIGQAVIEKAKRSGHQVLATTRRKDTCNAERIFLDLSQPTMSIVPSSLTTAIFCAGISSMKACELDPKSTGQVNVVGLLAVAEHLLGLGARIIYLSTNTVFDGQTPHVEPNHPPCPKTEYGRQHAQVEKILKQSADQVCIIRLTKVLTPSMPLIVDWLAKLRSGQSIEAFSDRHLAPVGLGLVSKAIMLAANYELGGLLQISADRDLSWAEVAKYLAFRTGSKDELVKSIQVADSVNALPHEPKNTTLDTSRLVDELNLHPNTVFETIDRLINLIHEKP